MGYFCFVLYSYSRKMKQPFFKDLYICSSLVNCSQLEEVEEPRTELMKVNISCPEDTYRVGKKTREK